MPFLSPDWRSPGEAWVKIDGGWERKKILECVVSYHDAILVQPSHKCPQSRDDEQDMVDMVENEGSGDVHERDLLRRGSLIRPPFCPITLKCTREVAGFNKLSEALKRLDFKSGIRDIRRFNYISRLMELLIVQNLTNLSGCAQRVLLNMLEEVTHHVAVSQTNIHILQKLVEDLRKTLYEYYCWGRPIGSTALWSQHWQTIDRIAQAANAIQIQPPDEDLIPKFGDLPPECVREILLRLACHKDLENAGRACDTMGSLVEEQRMWEPLCHFHFSPQQIAFAMKQLKIEDPKQCDWKILYHKLKRMYGVQEKYTEILCLCRNCCCLFWQSYGHPCPVDNDSKDAKHVPVTPEGFLKFFSL